MWSVALFGLLAPGYLVPRGHAGLSVAPARARFTRSTTLTSATTHAAPLLGPAEEHPRDAEEADHDDVTSPSTSSSGDGGSRPVTAGVRDLFYPFAITTAPQRTRRLIVRLVLAEGRD